MTFMKLTANKISLTALLAITIFSFFPFGSVQAKEKNYVGGGTITFIGAIVMPPCQIGAIDGHIETTCWSSNKGKPEITKTSLKKLRVGIHELPNSQGTQSFKWINKEQTLGVYTLTYN
ncbi:hypothetical protein PROSTU_03000 [Providencia stuartii ATCC 25827]|nr:hypothetical protein PROSTU_03000 [Providencia stuartii ATCC 25827]